MRSGVGVPVSPGCTQAGCCGYGQWQAAGSLVPPSSEAHSQETSVRKGNYFIAPKRFAVRRLFFQQDWSMIDAHNDFLPDGVLAAMPT